jgi:hypothetical protein
MQHADGEVGSPWQLSFHPCGALGPDDYISIFPAQETTPEGHWKFWVWKLSMLYTEPTASRESETGMVEVMTWPGRAGGFGGKPS